MCRIVLAGQSGFCHRNSTEGIIGEFTAMTEKREVLGLYIIELINASGYITYDCS